MNVETSPTVFLQVTLHPDLIAYLPRLEPLMAGVLAVLIALVLLKILCLYLTWRVSDARYTKRAARRRRSYQPKR